MDDIQLKELKISGNTDMAMQILITIVMAIMLWLITWFIFKDNLTCYLVTALFTSMNEWLMTQSRSYHDQPSLIWRIARKLLKILVVVFVSIPVYCALILISVIMYNNITAGADASVPIALYYAVISAMCVALVMMFIFASLYVIQAWRFCWDPLIPITEPPPPSSYGEITNGQIPKMN